MAGLPVIPPGFSCRRGPSSCFWAGGAISIAHYGCPRVESRGLAASRRRNGAISLEHMLPSSSVTSDPILRCPLVEIPIIFGVASRDLIEFAALCEFLERVGSRRLEQPIPRRCAAEIRRDERIRDAFGQCNVIGEFESECRGDGDRHEVGMRERRELDDPDPRRGI
jgi:hypothetical protein